MMKITLVALLAAVSICAQAQQVQGQGTLSSSTSVAGSTSQGGAGGAGGASNVSGVNASNGLTVGCLVNCANTDQGTKDLADSAVAAAAINAAAARDVAKTTQVIKNTPSVNGPALTTSNDTCMGSTSGSVNIAGLGIGGGTSWVDTNCKRLKNAREFWNMGMKGAAMALMCNDDENREALELTGYECPQTTRARNGNTKVQAAALPSQEQYTDPIVRARLGLPVLK